MANASLLRRALGQLFPMAVLILNISIIQLLLKALAEILQILRAQLGLFLQFVLGQPNGLFLRASSLMRATCSLVMRNCSFS